METDLVIARVVFASGALVTASGTSLELARAKQSASDA